MIPPYADRHSASHFKYYQVWHWDQRKTRRSVAVLLQTKNEVIRNHHDLGIVVGSYCHTTSTSNAEEILLSAAIY
jgi:hypothetical protein